MMEILFVIVSVVTSVCVLLIVLIQYSQREIVRSITLQRPPEDILSPIAKSRKHRRELRVTPSTPPKIFKLKHEFLIYYKNGINKVLVGAAYGDIEDLYDIKDSIRHNNFNEDLYTKYDGIEYKLHEIFFLK